MMDHIRLTSTYGAHNYHPLPVVLASGEGAWVSDVKGNRYLDCLAGYSALNFGHSNPRLLRRAHDQLDRLTLTSRAFYNDQLGPFLERLHRVSGKDRALPMNSGAEAVETALKIARRWGNDVRGIPARESSIIVMSDNFHGRTTTIVGFSSDAESRRGFGPYSGGFISVPYGDASAVQQAMTEHTVAVLVEPIQGEAGVVIPPEGYLNQLRALCTERNVLLIADEIQSGLGRTGTTFACDLSGIVPDLYILGKALGGGILPLSAVCCDAGIMDVITPGSHGSTFGGNPFASAVGSEVLDMISEGTYQRRASELGVYLKAGLDRLPASKVAAIRCVGLWAGIDVEPGLMSGRRLSERMLERGVLVKETHGSTIRLAPPLVVTESDIDLLVDALGAVLGEC